MTAADGRRRIELDARRVRDPAVLLREVVRLLRTEGSDSTAADAPIITPCVCWFIGKAITSRMFGSPSLVCHVLHERLGEPVMLEALGWATGPLRYVPADHGLDQPWDANGAVVVLASVVDADAMERGHVLALTGLTLPAGAHQWLCDPARVAASPMGKRVDHAMVNDLERVAQARCPARPIADLTTSREDI